MATAAPKTRRLRLGPRSAGLLLNPAEFDRASFQPGWRYELINEVLVVSPTPSRRNAVRIKRWVDGWKTIRRATPKDRPWMRPCRKRKSRPSKTAGDGSRNLGRLCGHDPEESETPSIAVEFVSKGKINQQRDYTANAPNSARSAFANTGSSTDFGAA